MNFYIYQKTPSDKCIILDPQQPLLREMDIPGNWSKLNLVVGWSFTSSTEDNASTAYPSSVRNLTVLDTFMWGVKDGSAIAPGMAGSEFMGVGTLNSHSAYVGLFRKSTNGYASIYGSEANDGQVYKADPTPVYTSGTNIMFNPTLYEQQRFSAPLDSSGDSNYFYWMILQLTRTEQTLAAATQFIQNQTDPSSRAMREFLGNAAPSPFGAISGTGLMPDLRHFYLRLPMLTARVRIHNYGYRLIA